MLITVSAATNRLQAQFNLNWLHILLKLQSNTYIIESEIISDWANLCY